MLKLDELKLGNVFPVFKKSKGLDKEDDRPVRFSTDELSIS